MSVLEEFIDIIYPPRCQFCRDFLWNDSLPQDRQGLPLCSACLMDLKAVSSPVCTLCGRPFQSGMDQDHLCEGCLRRRPFFDRAGAPYLYEGTMMSALHQFKYGGKSAMAASLGPLLAAFADTWMTKREEVLVMPVPLHFKRLRERGFNQSLLLARHVSSLLKSGLDFLSLRRVRYTSPQAGLKSSERRKNVRRAFQVMDEDVDFDSLPTLGLGRLGLSKLVHGGNCGNALKTPKTRGK